MMMKHSEPADEKVLEWFLEYGEQRRFKPMSGSKIMRSKINIIVDSDSRNMQQMYDLPAEPVWPV